MTDLGLTIAPKTDQLNADDLILGPRTITVTSVRGCDDPTQPIALHFEGDNGKPYKPCKSMRRVLVNAWGRDGNTYAGRSMTLYRDDKVLFGGIEVGGIRISHMSHISGAVTMALTASKASRKPFTVKPLKDAPAQPPGSPRTAEARTDAPMHPNHDQAAPGLAERVTRAVAALGRQGSAAALSAAWEKMAALRDDAKADPAQMGRLTAAYEAHVATLTTQPDEEPQY